MQGNVNVEFLKELRDQSSDTQRQNQTENLLLKNMQKLPPKWGGAPSCLQTIFYVSSYCT
jgi:hypothetical protein